MSLVTNFGQISADKHVFSWPNEGSTHSFRCKNEICDSAISLSHQLILLLTRQPVTQTCNQLVGLNQNGNIRFEIQAPDDYEFYYLSAHVRFETAVVCINRAKQKLDWFYAIDPQTGQLSSLNRAY